MRKLVPLVRVGTSEERVSAFLFLASLSMSGHVTGQNIHVNGGLSDFQIDAARQLGDKFFRTI